MYAVCVVVSSGGRGSSMCVSGGGLAGSAFKCSSGVAWLRLHVDVDGGGGGEDKGAFWFRA